MTASPTARRPRRGPRALGATAIAVLLALGPALPSTAATTPPPSAPPAETASSVVFFTLSPVAGGVVRPGEGFTAVVVVQNESVTTLPAGSARLLLGDAPLPTRAAVSEWGSAPDARALQQIGSVDLDAIGPGERRSWSFAFGAGDPEFEGRAAGVYPLLAVWGEGDEARTSASTLVVAPAAPATTSVGVVVPITTSPQSTGLLTADELVRDTAVDGTLTQQLDGVEGTGAILAVDPAVPAAIRILGASAPDTALAWLARLEALPNARFALQFGDADIASQLHSALGMLLQPLPFDAQMDPADFPSTAETPAPTATPGPSTALPDLEELLDIGGTPTPSVYWPATGSADAEVVADLVEGDPAALTLVSSDTTAAGSTGGTVPARGDDVLVYDSAISEALAAAADEDDQVVRGAELAAVAAQLAFAVPDAEGAPLLVSLDRGEGRSRVAIRAAIAAVADADGVELDDLRGIVTAPTTAVEVTGGEAGTDRAAVVDELVADEASIAEFATVLADARVLTAPQRAAVLQLLATGWRSDDIGWRGALATHVAASNEIRASVSIPPPTDVNLLTANTRLQFVVRNTLPWPVTVTLVASPDDPRLRVQRTTQVAAGAEADTRVPVPVESRVGSGDVTIGLQLLSPTGVAIGDADSVDVRVRAEWEGVGVVILSVVVGGLLVVGVVRTVLHRRARKRAA